MPTASPVPVRSPTPPPAYPGADSIATTPPVVPQEFQGVQENLMRAIAGVKSTTTRHTDSAIEGIATTLADLIRRVQEVESTTAGLVSASAASGKTTTNGPSSPETEKKFVDVYSKLSNLMSTYNQLNTTVQVRKCCILTCFHLLIIVEIFWKTWCE